MEMKEKAKALIIGINHNDNNFDESMIELKNLVRGCNYDIVGEVRQNVNKLNPSYYMGPGKVIEVTELVNETNADVVIFNDELSFAQIRNLEKDIECEVIDRTNLILDIFLERAKTKESQLQIEIARLQYMLPRLIGLHSLDRQRGGSLHNKGTGEKKLESDRRTIEKKIKQLKEELKVIVNNRNTQRRLRHKTKIPVVSLVGYTNAGKSTVMNMILENHSISKNKQVFEKDMLFATLDTSVRNITLNNNKSFLLTDTVGFINKLPHHLVDAFKSTLEELSEADVLVHVIDASNPNHKEHIDTTYETLQSIGIKGIPVIEVYNKSDLMDIELPQIDNNKIYLSAKEDIGLDKLINMISDRIFKDYVICQMFIPYQEGHLLSYFNESANVIDTSYDYEGIKLKIECKKVDYEKFQDYVM